MKSTLRLSKYIHLRSTLNQVFCRFCHTSLTIGLWFSACSETGKAAVKVLLFEMCHMRLKKMSIFNVFRISSDHWNYQCIQRYHKLKRNLAQYCVFTRCDLWPYWKMLTCKKTWMFAYFTIQVKQKCSCKCQVKSLGSNTKEGEFPFRVGQFWINKKIWITDLTQVEDQSQRKRSPENSSGIMERKICTMTGWNSLDLQPDWKLKKTTFLWVNHKMFYNRIEYALICRNIEVFYNLSIFL